jgi:hypothetical protein
MSLRLPATIVLDQAAVTALLTALEPSIKEIVADSLRELSSDDHRGGRNALSTPAHYLISSIYPSDLLHVVEAPDVTAGERKEPHWRIVQDIRRGDIILFRDSTRKALVGAATADRTEKGLHRHAPNKHAIRWWLTEPTWFDRPISDAEFRRAFLEHDDGSAGFKLFRKSGEFSQKTYAYPLNQATAAALFPVN